MNKIEGFFLFSVFLIVILTQFISSDIISINSGGDSQLCINSGGDIENCFFGATPSFCIAQNCSSLGYTCGIISDGCGNAVNCGNCLAGYTCSAGTCILSSSSSSSSGGGGSSSGGGPTQTPIVLTPSELNLTLSFNNISHTAQRATHIIYVSNRGNVEQTFTITQSGLRDIAMVNSTLITIPAGEVRSFSVDFVAPFEEQDIYGFIFVGNYELPVSAHITSNPLWFDSNIVVLNKNYQVSRGSQLRTRVELVPMGDKQTLDVTLNYVIKDYDGKVYLTQQETILVSKRTSFDKIFNVGSLPLGNYVIALDLIYPGGVAPSSAHFEVAKQDIASLFGVILFFLTLAILAVSFFIIFLIIKRKRIEKWRRMKEIESHN
jgi:hypothetical protein